MEGPGFFDSEGVCGGICYTVFGVGRNALPRTKPLATQGFYPGWAQIQSERTDLHNILPVPVKRSRLIGGHDSTPICRPKRRSSPKTTAIVDPSAIPDQCALRTYGPPMNDPEAGFRLDFSKGGELFWIDSCGYFVPHV